MDWSIIDPMSDQFQFVTDDETDLQFDLLLQQFSPTPILQQQLVDLLPTNTPPTFSLPQNNSTNINHAEENIPTDSMKKISHREHEKRRRKEMAGYCRSLRTLLPPEYIKGKRSPCDHIHETVRHIKELQVRIKNLTKQRDEVKQKTSPYNKGKEPYLGCNQSNVTVQPSMAGFDVLINTCIERGVTLSNVLNTLIPKGLSIISCNSIQVNGRLLHNIQIEVKKGRIIDPVELQQILRDYCCNGYSPSIY